MKNQPLKNKKIAGDMTLNIIAATLPVATLQLIVYPVIAKAIGSEEYGFMLTVWSIWILFPNSLGATINNIRLLYSNKYADGEEIGDFAFIHRKWTSFGALLVFLAIWLYTGSFNTRHLLLGIIVSIFITTRTYLEVGFRLEFNYIKILICNVFQSLGFIIGCVITYYTRIWEIIFISGYGLACVYCIMNTGIAKERPIKTNRYKEIIRDAYNLGASVIIHSLVGYADKLVLFPLMGGTAVSIYYTATILGKITGLLTTPINGVILNYIANWNNDDKNLFSKSLIITSLLSTLVYFVTVLFARPVIEFLFPQWVEEVMKYLPVTTATVSIGIISSVLQPFVMKFCAMKWQTIINGVTAATYFLSAILLWYKYGLMGFCCGTIIGAILKLLMIISIYYYFKNRANNLLSNE